MAGSVITFSDAELVKWLESHKQGNESPSLTAKRMLNDYRAAMDRGDLSSRDAQDQFDDALEQIGKAGDLLRQLRPLLS